MFSQQFVLGNMTRKKTEKSTEIHKSQCFLNVNIWISMDFHPFSIFFHGVPSFFHIFSKVTLKIYIVSHEYGQTGLWHSIWLALPEIYGTNTGWWFQPTIGW